MRHCCTIQTCFKRRENVIVSQTKLVRTVPTKEEKKKRKKKTERDRDRQNEEPSFLGRCFKQQQQQQQQQQNSSEVTSRERALMMYFLSGPRGVER